MEHSEHENKDTLDDLIMKLKDFIIDARDANRPEILRCRPLSESITCAETALLWLHQLNSKNNLLDFS